MKYWNTAKGWINSAIKKVPGKTANTMDGAIKALMKQEHPNIAILPAYSKEGVTVAQSEQVDYILGQVAQSRKGQRDELQQHLLAKTKKAFDKIWGNIQELERYGIRIDTTSIDKQMKLLEENKTLMRLAEKCYRIGDAKCMEVLKLQSGKKKKNDFRKFENEVLAEGVDMYFEQLSSACDVLFAFIDNAVKTEQETQQEEKSAKNETAKIINLINELVASRNANTRQMLETDRAEMRSKAIAGEYTRYIQENEKEEE